HNIDLFQQLGNSAAGLARIRHPSVVGYPTNPGITCPVEQIRGIRWFCDSQREDDRLLTCLLFRRHNLGKTSTRSCLVSGTIIEMGIQVDDAKLRSRKSRSDPLVRGPRDFVAATDTHGEFVLLQQLAQSLTVALLRTFQVPVRNDGVPAIKQGDLVMHSRRPQGGTDCPWSLGCTHTTLISDHPFI